MEFIVCIDETQVYFIMTTAHRFYNAEYYLQKISLTEDEIDNLFKKFNGLNYKFLKYDIAKYKTFHYFDNEDDTENFCNYLNEVYLPMLKLMGG